MATANNRLMVTFYVDSQAALMAFKSTMIRSSVVLNCVKSLDALGAFTRVSLRYIKAHVGHAGNELADDMVKEGAANVDNVHGPDPLLPVSDAYSKKFLADALNDYWTTQWQARSDCRQTKIWFPTPNTRVSANLSHEDGCSSVSLCKPLRDTTSSTATSTSSTRTRPGSVVCVWRTMSPPGM